MTCRVANYLYDLVPLTAWQALIIRLHHARCPGCSREYDIDADIRRLTIKPADLPRALDLWTDVRRSLTWHMRWRSAYIRHFWTVFSVVFVTLIVLLTVLVWFVYYLGEIV